jgi:hypothetical protein
MFPETARRCGNCFILFDGVGYVCEECITAMRRAGMWCELHGPTGGHPCLGCRKDRLMDLEAAFGAGREAGIRTRKERPDCSSWLAAYADNMRSLSESLSMGEDTTSAYRDGFRDGWQSVQQHKWTAPLADVPCMGDVELDEGIDLCPHCLGEHPCTHCGSRGLLPICPDHGVTLHRDGDLLYCPVCDEG